MHGKARQRVASAPPSKAKDFHGHLVNKHMSHRMPQQADLKAFYEGLIRCLQVSSFSILGPLDFFIRTLKPDCHFSF